LLVPYYIFQAQFRNEGSLGEQAPPERRHPCLQKHSSALIIPATIYSKSCRLGACVPLQIASTPFSLNSVSSTPMPIARLRRNASTTGTQAPLPAKHNLALVIPTRYPFQTMQAGSLRAGSICLMQAGSLRSIADCLNHIFTQSRVALLQGQSQGSEHRRALTGLFSI